ncbi:MAG: hypothetical protein R3339_00575 [Thermodesulfobacteriota bacterium]|nr:hypothetical protein [Thermodesulfobacteriota bacterium]
MRKRGIHGKINFGCLTLTILLIAGGYVGYKFGRVYLGKYMFDRKVFEITGDVAEDWKAKIFPSDGDIVEALLKEARRHGVTITPDDIEIDRDAKRVIINIIWEGDIVMPFYTHHFIYNFDYERKVYY